MQIALLTAAQVLNDDEKKWATATSINARSSFVRGQNSLVFCDFNFCLNAGKSDYRYDFQNCYKWNTLRLNVNTVEFFHYLQNHQIVMWHASVTCTPPKATHFIDKPQLRQERCNSQYHPPIHHIKWTGSVLLHIHTQ